MNRTPRHASALLRLDCGSCTWRTKEGECWIFKEFVSAASSRDCNKFVLRAQRERSEAECICRAYELNRYLAEKVGEACP